MIAKSRIILLLCLMVTASGAMAGNSFETAVDYRHDSEFLSVENLQTLALMSLVVVGAFLFLSGNQSALPHVMMLVIIVLLLPGFLDFAVLDNEQTRAAVQEAIKDEGSGLALMVIIGMPVLFSVAALGAHFFLQHRAEESPKRVRQFSAPSPDSVEQLRERQQQSAAEPVVVSRVELSAAKPAEVEPVVTKPCKRKVFLD